MIRIDLSRDELGRGSSGNTAITQMMGKLKLPKQLQDMLPKGGGGGGRGGDQSAMLIALGISGAAALLPSLFLSQYKQYVINENQTQIKAIQDSVVQVNADIAKLTPYQKELDTFEGQKALVRQRLDVIRQLLDQRGTPVNILDAVGQNLPPRTWVQNMEMVLKGPAPQLNIAASSMSNEEISDFVDKLSESVYFNDVTLQEVTNAKEATIDVKKFTLVAHPKLRNLASNAAPTATPANSALPNTGAPADPNAAAGATPAPPAPK